MKTIFSILFFTWIIFLSISVSFGNDIELGGTLENLEKTDLLEGDLFKAKITILPLQSVIISEIQKALFQKNFLNFFSVIDIDSISVSQNNSEVLEIYLTLLLHKAFESREFYIWSYKGLNIPFLLKNITPSKNSSKIKTYLIHEQSRDNHIKYLVWYVLLISLIAIGTLSLFLRSYFKNKKLKEKREENKKIFSKYKDKFTRCSTRKEFEEIVFSQEIWKKFITNDIEKIDELINKIKNHMYEPNWDDTLMQEVLLVHNQCHFVLGEKWK